MPPSGIGLLAFPSQKNERPLKHKGFGTGPPTGGPVFLAPAHGFINGDDRLVFATFDGQLVLDLKLFEVGNRLFHVYLYWLKNEISVGTVKKICPKIPPPCICAVV